MFWNFIYITCKNYSKYDWKYVKVLSNNHRIAIDPIFPPPEYSKWMPGKKDQIPENIFKNNSFELIFDELVDSQELKKLFESNKSTC